MAWMVAGAPFWQNAAMRRTVPMILLALGAGPLWAENLTADAFDAYTRGKTLYYGSQGEPYGAERYLDGRRVVWSFLDGKCQDGVWYESDGKICFVYENNLTPQCWTFRRGEGGLIARFENDPETSELYEAQDIDEEMMCLGPDVGV